MTLGRDTEVVRAALLYADSALLISPAAIMVGSIAALGEWAQERWSGYLQTRTMTCCAPEVLTPSSSDRVPQVLRLPRDDRRRALGPEAA